MSDVPRMSKLVQMLTKHAHIKKSGDPRLKIDKCFADTHRSKAALIALSIL